MANAVDFLSGGGSSSGGGGVGRILWMSGVETFGSSQVGDVFTITPPAGQKAVIVGLAPATGTRTGVSVRTSGGNYFVQDYVLRPSITHFTEVSDWFTISTSGSTNSNANAVVFVGDVDESLIISTTHNTSYYMNVRYAYGI